MISWSESTGLEASILLLGSLGVDGWWGWRDGGSCRRVEDGWCFESYGGSDCRFVI